MKKAFLFISLLSSSLFAQTLTYSFSNEFETIKKHDDMGFYKLNADEYAEVYFKREEDMIFQIFDKDFKNVKKTETVTFPEFEQRRDNEGFFNIKNNFFWVYSTWDRKTETERLFALPFHKENFKFESTPIKLIETKRLVPYNKYRFNYSTDSTKVLVTYVVKPKEKRDKLNKDIIGFNLYDDNMQKQYAAEIEMPYSEYDMNNLDYEVDSRGNIYMLTEVKINNSLDGEVDRENKNAMRYELIRVDQKNNTLQRIKINLDNKYTNSVVLSEDLNHNIVIAGYYSDKRNSGGSNGAYIIRLEYGDNNSIKNLTTTYCEFPAETLKAYENERTQRKMEKREKDNNLEAANLVFRNLEFYPDGSMMIIGEEYYMVTNTYYNGRTTYTSYTYFYNDILVLKADKNGKTIWCNKIPKQQSGKGYMDLSYHHHSYNGEDFFLYLDNAKNINLSLTETPAPHSSGLGGYLTCVKIDANGKMTKRSIFDIRQEHVNIYPRSFESLNGNLILDRLKADRNESRVFKIELK
ncbi:MAG: hypothetical protein HY062_09320 [Bacteroidetes bacterium]|nr:hypothetical protein [Bacteroidota bacterium]